MRKRQSEGEKNRAGYRQREVCVSPRAGKEGPVAGDILDQEWTTAESSKGREDADESDHANERTILSNAERANNNGEVQTLDREAQDLTQRHPEGVASEWIVSEEFSKFGGDGIQWSLQVSGQRRVFGSAGAARSGVSL